MLKKQPLNRVDISPDTSSFHVKWIKSKQVQLYGQTGIELTFRSANLGVSHCCHFLVVWLRANHLTILNLGFLILKNKDNKYSSWFLWRSNEIYFSKKASTLSGTIQVKACNFIVPQCKRKNRLAQYSYDRYFQVKCHQARVILTWSYSLALPVFRVTILCLLCCQSVHLKYIWICRYCSFI